MKNYHICDSLPCIALLAKISKDFDCVWGSYGQKKHPEAAKIVLSAAMETFDI